MIKPYGPELNGVYLAINRYEQLSIIITWQLETCSCYYYKYNMMRTPARTAEPKFNATHTCCMQAANPGRHRPRLCFYNILCAPWHAICAGRCPVGTRPPQGSGGRRLGRAGRGVVTTPLPISAPETAEPAATSVPPPPPPQKEREYSPELADAAARPAAAALPAGLTLRRLVSRQV